MKTNYVHNFDWMQNEIADKSVQLIIADPPYHPTPKPEKMIRAMILTTTKKNDTILIPFAGSGTECAMAAKEKRNFYGFEIVKKWADDSNKRVHAINSKIEIDF